MHSLIPIVNCSLGRPLLRASDHSDPVLASVIRILPWHLLRPAPTRVPGRMRQRVAMRAVERVANGQHTLSIWCSDMVLGRT
jgi:hypothetical protein